jgi:hypothetical protein
MDSETKAKIKELEGKGWMKVSMIFEVLGTNKKIVKKSLKEHIEKLEKIKTCLIYKKDFSKIDKVKKPLPNIKEGYSQFVEVECMIKNLETLFVISISYGPSSIEIIKPKKIEISAGEIQNLTNLIAGTIHKIAEAGFGGIIATPRQ